MNSPSVPRYVADLELPPYSYVPGVSLHPTSHPQGHSFGHQVQVPREKLPDQWQSCRVYLVGIDLFNNGYYWEAHEYWEAAWIAAGRTGIAANFLKGLIKLAAAGVKWREGRSAGVRRHARRAKSLFEQTKEYEYATYMGQCLQELIAHTESIVNIPTLAAQGSPSSRRFAFQLRLTSNCNR